MRGLQIHWCQGPGIWWIKSSFLLKGNLTVHFLNGLKPMFYQNHHAEQISKELVTTSWFFLWVTLESFEIIVFSKHVLLRYSTYFVLAALFISFDLVFLLPVPVFVECVSAWMVCNIVWTLVANLPVSSHKSFRF